MWCALSDLFLDTELDAATGDRIAAAARDAGFDATQTHDILAQEVVPAFGVNLFAVAGEWTPWSADFVRERVLATQRSWLGRAGGRLMWRMLRRSMAAEWDQIARRI